MTHPLICSECHYHESVIAAAKQLMPDDDKLFDLAEFFKVFADSTRIRILTLLMSNEMCVCDISEALAMNQSAISHQLRLLRNSRLVKSRREGKSIFYSLDDDHVASILWQGLSHLSEEASGR